MKRLQKKFIAMMLVVSMFLLQGCSVTKPETSHLVTLDTAGKVLTAELKASTGDGYEWQYVLDNGSMTESSASFSNNIFSNTYGSTYTFTCSDIGNNVLYLILVQNGDYDTAKVFSYMISIDNSSVMKIDKEGSFLLPANIDLYKRVTAQ